jgi:hypothetical protein
MPLVSLYKLREMGAHNKLYAELHKIVAKNDYIWSVEAEKYLLAHAKPI